MMDFTLRARWLLPIDGPAIEGGYLRVVNGRVASVGRARPANARVEDLGDFVLMPGLVNVHTHLEFSDLRAPLGTPGMRFPDWIRLVIAERKRGDHVADAAVRAGLVESLAAGVTTIGEISTCPPSSYGVPGPRPQLVAFQESIGFSAARVDSALDDLEHRFHAAACPAGFSPHAPYTVHPQLVERIVAHAAAYGAPVAMHLAESPEELQLLEGGTGAFRELLEERSMWDELAIPRGTRPLDYLRSLAAAPRALVIHGNYLAAEEIEFLGQHRSTMSVAFCPRTHAYFDHAPYPLSDMLAAGVRVVLGTDSRASNPDLDLQAEVSFAASQFPDVAPTTWLRMATLEAAEALGVVDEVGSLTPGKRAHLVALHCELAERDPAAGIVGGVGRVERAWIDGMEAVVRQSDAS